MSSTAPRQDRIAALLDQALIDVNDQLDTGEITAATLREIASLARAAGVPLIEHGQSMSPATDHVLESMRDLDPSLFQ